MIKLHEWLTGHIIWVNTAHIVTVEKGALTNGRVSLVTRNILVRETRDEIMALVKKHAR